ncbi:MAG: cyclic nucleotide-binding domain-containing protein [Leptospirales bacterium]|jgi:CRP/FNR family cyclic AMP-dependent transcriptional regulator
MSKIRDALKAIYLFQELTADEVDQIAAMVTETRYNSGQTVFYEGDAADAMYVIAYGTVELEEGGEKLGVLGTGAHFGELPLLDGMNRQLTIRCQEASTIYTLPFDKLTVYLNSDNKVAADFYRALAHFLSTRLRKVDRELAVIKEHYHK